MHALASAEAWQPGRTVSGFCCTTLGTWDGYNWSASQYGPGSAWQGQGWPKKQNGQGQSGNGVLDLTYDQVSVERPKDEDEEAAGNGAGSTSLTQQLQRALNASRKAYGKVRKLEEERRTKVLQWQAFQQQLRKAYNQQSAKHSTDLRQAGWRAGPSSDISRGSRGEAQTDHYGGWRGSVGSIYQLRGSRAERCAGGSISPESHGCGQTGPHQCQGQDGSGRSSDYDGSGERLVAESGSAGGGPHEAEENEYGAADADGCWRSRTWGPPSGGRFGPLPFWRWCDGGSGSRNAVTPITRQGQRTPIKEVGKQRTPRPPGLASQAKLKARRAQILQNARMHTRTGPRLWKKWTSKATSRLRMHMGHPYPCVPSSLDGLPGWMHLQGPDGFTFFRL